MIAIIALLIVSAALLHSAYVESKRSQVKVGSLVYDPNVETAYMVIAIRDNDQIELLDLPDNMLILRPKWIVLSDFQILIPQTITDIDKPDSTA